MTETSELDCMAAVASRPKPRLFHSRSVVRRSRDSSVPPVKALKPSSSDSMPNRKIATPAAMVLKSGLSQKP